MALAALLRPLAWIWIGLAAAAAIAGLAAYALGESQVGPSFLATAGAAGFAGGLLAAVTRGAPIQAQSVDALALAVFVFAISPVIAAAPFMIAGVRESWLDASFEAVAAISTTGATLVAPGEELQSFFFWRCLLSWLGGYATLILASAVLAAVEREAPAIRRSVLLTVQADNVFSHLPVAARRIGLIYLVLTALVWLGLLFSDASFFESVCLALSSISTGGYPMGEGGVDAAIGEFGAVILAVACLAGATNIAVFWDVLRDRKVLRDPDLAGVAIFTLLLAALYMAAAPERGVFPAVLDSVFAVTTAGFTADGDVMAAPAAGLLAALIGGAAASTAGGVKVSRILLLWRRLGAELAVLADPSSVARVTHRGKTAPDRALVAVWSYVLAFAAVLGAGGILIGQTGVSFDRSFAATAAALANAGPLFTHVEAGLDWNDLPSAAHAVLIPVMILGRLEVIAVLAAIWSLFRRA